MYKLHTCFVRSISNYLSFLSDCKLYCILILVSIYKLQVYRSTIGFCVFFSYPENILYTLISSRNYLCGLLGISSKDPYVICEYGQFYFFISDLPAFCFLYFLLLFFSLSSVFRNFTVICFDVNFFRFTILGRCSAL